MYGMHSLVDKDLSFKAFEVKGKTKALEGGCYICRMRRIQVATVHNADGSCFLLFELVGNRFLRHLVRAIVVLPTCFSNLASHISLLCYFRVLLSSILSRKTGGWTSSGSCRGAAAFQEKGLHEGELSISCSTNTSGLLFIVRRVVIAPGLGLALCGVGYCSKEILS
jgi:hypothetical protein